MGESVQPSGLLLDLAGDLHALHLRAVSPPPCRSGWHLVNQAADKLPANTAAQACYYVELACKRGMLQGVKPVACIWLTALSADACRHA